MEAAATKGRPKYRKSLEPGIEAKASPASSIAKQYV